MKINECSTPKNSRMLLESVTLDMTKKQKYIVESIVKEFRPLIEATLTTQQIGQIFAAAEQGAVSSGKNRTLVGKGVDVAKLPAAAVKKVNDTINNVGKWLQNTAPVQGFDAKFEQLKNTINQKFPDSKLLDGISQMGIWAKENPGKTAAIIGVLTALASLAGGPVGGAIAGQVLRGANELLKGEKLSTAIGKGAKSAVMGFLAGKALEYVSDAVIGNTVASGEEAISQTEAAMKAANYHDALDNLDPSIRELMPQLKDSMTLTTQGSYNNFTFSYDVVLNPEQVQQYQAYQAAIDAAKSFSDEKVAKVIEFHNWMNSIQQDPNQTLYKVAIDAIQEIENSDVLTVDQLKSLIQQHDNLEQTVEALKTSGAAGAAAVQGAVTAAEQDKKNAQKAGPPSTQQGSAPAATESKYIDKVQTNRFLLLSEALGQKRSSVILTNEGVNVIFKHVVNEGPLDAIKGAVGKAAGAVANKAATVGKNLTNKVTANKLNALWKKAGSPTDSDKIAALLKQAGVSDSIIASTYQGLKIPAPAGLQQQPSTVQPTSTTTAANRPTSTAQPNQQTTGGAGAMGSMARQLGGSPGATTSASTNVRRSSTGGSTVQTPTGQVHTANPSRKAGTSNRNFAPGRSTQPATTPTQEPAPTQEPETQYDKFKRIDRENQRREKQLQKQQSVQQRLGTATAGNTTPSQGSTFDEPLLIGLLTAAKAMSPEKISALARTTIQLNKTKGNLTSSDLRAILQAVK